MGRKISGEMWDEFFGNPIISSFLEEAAVEPVDSDDDPAVADAPAEGDGKGGATDSSKTEEQGQNLDQLIADFQQGTITQDDLVSMYKAGNLSKEDIQKIIDSTEGQEGQGEPQDQEELLAQQIGQTNDMFVKFALYDKIQELTEKLDYFKENFDDMQSGIYDRVVQLSEFLNILSGLIFSIETAIAYQMYGSILLQLTELFDQYNQISQEKDQAQQMRNS
jgi:hypothetical protein